MNCTNLANKLNNEANLPLRHEDIGDLDMFHVARRNYDSDYDDSGDDNSIITDREGFEEDNYWECTSFDLVTPELNRKVTLKSAPNRLLNIQKIKKMIDSNLTICPICEKNERECDGDSK